MTVGFTVHGFSDLEKALKSLAADMQQKAAQSASRKSAKVVADKIKAAAPVSNVAQGATQRRYRKNGSYRIQTHDKIVNSIKVRKIKAKNGSEVANAVTTGNAFHAYWVEFGSIRQPARPFIRNTFDANKEAALDAMKVELARQITRRGGVV